MNPNATPKSIRAGLLPMLFLVALAAGSGCGETRIETTYGRLSGRSVNGTGAFAELLRQRGHEVRAARRLNDEVAEWADTIVRFLPEPGVVGEEEADWYSDWQFMDAGRRLVLVCRDGGAEAEYWAAVLANLPANAPRHLRDRIEYRLGQAGGWGGETVPSALEEADPFLWFRLDDSPGLVSQSKTLSGPWAEGVDPAAADLPIGRALLPTDPSEFPLLIGDDDRVLAMTWSWDDDYDEDWESSAVLVIANGSFLLNAAIIPHARRPLTAQAADWVGSRPRNVAFIEGSFLIGEGSSMPTPWQVIRQIPELGVVAGHFMVLALIAALAHAVILGRPRAAPGSGADRPRAHAEALGYLLARMGSDRASRAMLTTYRRWRRPQALDDRPGPDDP